MYYLKLKLILIFSFFALLVNASDYYITTADLNLRSGAGSNYKSLTVLAKGDTVKMIDSTGNYWVKVQYQDKIGYSAKQYLQPIIIPDETDTAGGNTFLIVLILLALTIVSAVILKQSGEKYRSQSTTTLLSFFFGSIGLQKFYLGESNKGVLSILFCWTFIPTLIGLIDFIRYATMNENKFHNKFNGGIKKKNQRQPKATPNKAPFRNQQVITNPNFDSKTNIIRLYNKGLQLNEILNSAIDLDLKMPSGASITNIYQIKELIKSVYPNAQFETVQASYSQKSDSTIIDVNSEKLDLTVEKTPFSTSE